jgi:hypothetical protein
MGAFQLEQTQTFESWLPLPSRAKAIFLRRPFDHSATCNLLFGAINKICKTFCKILFDPPSPASGGQAGIRGRKFL